MKNTIPYYIREHLRDSRCVYIKGIGEFKLVQHSAKITSYGDCIQPPTLSLSLFNNVGDDTSLIKRISKIEDFSLAKAEKKLTKFTDNTFNKLLNLKKANIKGFGTLLLREDNRISFIPSVIDLTDEYNGLKALPLKEVRYIPSASIEPVSNVAASNVISADQVFKPVQNSTQIATKSTVRNIWLSVLMGILIAVFYILFTKTCNGFPAGLDNTDKDIVPVSMMDDDSITVSEELLTEEDIAFDKNSETIVEEPVEPKKIDRIIVGSFAKQRNVQRMVEKLKYYGFSPIISKQNGLTRVGIATTDTLTDLKKIHAQIDTGAWVLK